MSREKLVDSVCDLVGVVEQCGVGRVGEAHELAARGSRVHERPNPRWRCKRVALTRQDQQRHVQLREHVERRVGLRGERHTLACTGVDAPEIGEQLAHVLVGSPHETERACECRPAW